MPVLQNSSTLITHPPIAWPSRLPNQGSYATSGTNLGGTARHCNYVQQSASGIQLVYTNFYPNQGGSDLGVPTNAGAITVSATLEYPADTFWPVFFKGQSSVTIALGGIVVSDPIGIEVIGGQTLAPRTYIQAANPGTIPIGCFSGNIDSVIPSGNGIAFVADGTQGGDNYPTHNTGAGTNQLTTVGQSWISANGQFSYGPTAILGKPVSQTQQPIVGLLGDSIIDGSIDQGHDFGFAMRALVGAGIGLHRLCRGGENGVLPSGGSWQSAAGHFVRATLGESVTSIIWEYGTNDLAAGTTNWKTGGTNFYPAILAAWKLVQTQFTVPFFVTTITPRVTGIGSNAAAQAPINTLYESTRQSYNAWLRAPASAGSGNSAAFDLPANGMIFSGCIDIASYVETDTTNKLPGGPSAPNLGGRWYCGAANNSASDTGFGSDGVHPTDTGHIAMIPAINISALAVPGTAVGNGSSSGTARGNG